MQTFASLVLAGLMLSGCGSRMLAARHGGIPVASCARVPNLAAAPLSGESGVYRAGPLTLSIGSDLAQLERRRPAATSGSEAIALITSNRAVTVHVEPNSPVRFVLQFTPFGRGHPSPTLSDGRRTVRFPACGTGAHRFFGGILFAGAGCARLAVTTAGQPVSTMLIPIGNTLTGCPTTRRARRLPPAALPFLGVACRRPDWIGCERVGVGVSTRVPAILVVVRIAGRIVALSPPNPPRTSTIWLGYLDGVSFRRGPLRIPVSPHETQWQGSPEVLAQVRVTEFLPGSQVASVTGRVLLHPGFG